MYPGNFGVMMINSLSLSLLAGTRYDTSTSYHRYTARIYEVYGMYAHIVYISVNKYQDILCIHISLKRALCFGTESYLVGFSWLQPLSHGATRVLHMVTLLRQAIISQQRGRYSISQQLPNFPHQSVGIHEGVSP